MSVVLSLFIVIAGNVFSHYIIKWLDSKWR